MASQPTASGIVEYVAEIVTAELQPLIDEAGNVLTDITDAKDAALADIDAEGVEQAAIVSNAASAAEAVATTYADGLATGSLIPAYESVGASSHATLATNVGVYQVVLINGTHVTTGDVIAGIRWPWACGATTSTVEIKIWKRDVSGATGAGTLNNAAPIATHDTLLATYSTTPTVLGITAGTSTAAQGNDYTFSSPFTIEAGYDYVFQFRNLDGTSTVVNCGFLYFSATAPAQRRAGFQALTASPTTFTNITTARTPSITLLKKEQKTQLPATDAQFKTRLDNGNIVARMNADNDRNLALAAAMFPNTLAVTASYWGDSLFDDSTGGGSAPAAGYRLTEVVDAYTIGTVNNYGTNGNTGAQVTTRVLAGSGADLAGFNAVMMGTNDLSSGTAASVLTSYATCAAAFTNTNYLFASPWQNGAMAANLNARKAYDIRAGLRSTYGSKFLDSQLMWARYASGTVDRAAARGGAIPTSLTVDGLHKNSAGALIHGKVHAAALIARNGGAPFIHDDVWTIKAADAAATVVGTVRWLGTATNFEILHGNEDNALQINRATGEVTKTGNTVLMPYRELYITAANNKGAARVGRIIVTQVLDGTTPNRGVRIQGNGASFLMANSTWAPSDGNELTIVMCARMLRSNVTGLHVIGDGSNAFLSNTNWGFGFNPRASGSTSTLGAISNIVAEKPSDWNFYFFSMNSASGLMKAVVNEGTAATTVPTNAVSGLSKMHTLFTNSGNTLPFMADIKMFAVYSTYYDVADTAVRAVWYDSTTKAPKDIGSAGTAGGSLSTPFHYLYGRAGNYLTGLNGGSAGTLHTPPPISYADVGFVDVD